MTGDAETVWHRIITPITFLFHPISKKATEPRTRLEFGVFMRLEQNKTDRTKNTKLMVSGRRAKQPLVRGAMGKNRCRQPVDSVDSCESGFTPKRSRNQRGKEKSTNNV